MSTQRRENRWRRTSCTKQTEASGSYSPRPVARCACSFVSGGTAPPETPAWFHPSDEDLSPGTPVRLATISLQSGFRIVKLVREEVRQLSPPFGDGSGEAIGTPAIYRFPHPHIPSPSGHARLHLTLPRVPAG